MVAICDDDLERIAARMSRDEAHDLAERLLTLTRQDRLAEERAGK